MQQPNIIYMHSHDTGRYVSPYGHNARTPNMQRFADQGVLFRQAFTTNPTCSPSRACLVTGQYAHNNGMLGLSHRGFRLNDYNKHIVHTLKSAGYHSVLAGVQHVAPRDEVQHLSGYDQILDTPGNHTDSVTPAAVNFLQNAPDKPFFMAIGFQETHRGFPPPHPADNPDRTAAPAPLPHAPEIRRDMAGYNTMVNRLDGAMGSILATLDETGLRENTIVIITTDHGIAFPHMKCNLTDHGTGVMLMMRGPTGSGLEGGKTIDSLVTQLDLFPTICEWAGADKPNWLQGQSLMPLVRGEKETLRDEVFAEVNFHAAYEPKRAVRTQRYQYIKRFDGRDRPVLSNIDNGLSKQYLMARGWPDMQIDQEYLFDLDFDPNATRNLIEHAQYQDVLMDMRGRLDQWMRDTDDPLLNGPIMMQPGLVMNTPDQHQPQEEAERIETARPAP